MQWGVCMSFAWVGFLPFLPQRVLFCCCKREKSGVTQLCSNNVCCVQSPAAVILTEFHAKNFKPIKAREKCGAWGSRLASQLRLGSAAKLSAGFPKRGSGGTRPVVMRAHVEMPLQAGGKACLKEYLQFYRFSHLFPLVPSFAWVSSPTDSSILLTRPLKCCSVYCLS